MPCRALKENSVKDQAASVSLLTVLVTVTLSDVPLLLLLPLPFKMAASKRINKAAPATHTQGELYQVVVSSNVVVVVVDETVLSCAQVNV